MTVRRLAAAAARRGRSVPTRVTDRRFRTRLVHDAGGPAMLLSPHLDDAVLNCWSILTRAGETAVMNVFGGVPADGVLTDWDRLCGARDSASLMCARLDEDRAALSLARRAAVTLPFLDAQYRGTAPPPSMASLDGAVASVAPAVSCLVAPLAWVHEDHRALRAYAEAAGIQAGIPVSLYADVPYASRYGWPTWATGDARDPRLDVDGDWERNGLVPARELARVVRLDPPAAAAKLAAMQTYATQFPALDQGPLRVLSNPEIHRHEVFWDLPPRPSAGSG